MANVSGGSVVWDLDVEDGKLTSGLSNAKKQVETTAKDVDSKMGDMAGNVQSKMRSMSDSIVESFRTGGLAVTAFFTTAGLLGKQMISVASDFEQNRIAFETLVGSAKEGRKVLAELSDFAVKTPFELPSLQTSAKQLLAYGVSAKELIPTLEMLGNMAAGVGMDKMPQLILAFGQVKAATTLTGAELRQFSEAGVPLLQALVDQANEAGGVLTKVGGASKDTTKKMASLASKIASTELEMQFFKETGGKTDKQLQAMQKTIDLNKYKLGQFGDVGQEVYTRVKVTAAEMKDKISDGAVTFEDVQKALAGMTGEGGRFFNLMEKQSKTFGGVMSNIRDQVTRSFAEIMGVSIDEGGIIREGSIFAALKSGAEAALAAIDRFTPILVDFTQKLVANKDAVMVIAGALLGALALAIGSFIVTFGAGIYVLGQFMAAGALVAGVVAGLRGSFDNFSSGVSANFELVKGYIKNIEGEFKAFAERLYDTLNLDTSNIGIVDFFSQLSERIKPGLDEFVRQVQQGFTNALTINFGEGANFGDLFGKIMGVVQPLIELFLRVLTPAIDRFSESLARSKPMIDTFLQQIGPIMINALQVFVLVLGTVIATFIALFSGIATGIATALPFVIQTFTGLAEFFSGILNIIMGIFNLFYGTLQAVTSGNWAQLKAVWSQGLTQIWEGVKTTAKGIYDIIVGFFGSILAFIGGFIEGIINFFKQLYDVLVGHSIVPDLVNKIKEWFGKLPGMVANALSGLVNALTQPFRDAWSAIEPIINKIKEGLDKINPFHRNSPSLVDNVKAGVGIIMDEYANLGRLQFPAVAYQMPQYADPMYSAVSSSPMDRSGGAVANSNQQINVYIDEVKDSQDIEVIAREIGFKTLVQ